VRSPNLSPIAGLVAHPGFRWFIGLLIVSVLVLVLPTDQLLAALRRISPASWTQALGAFLLLHVVAAFKWRLVLTTGDGTLPFVTAVRCHFAGLFANLFLPSVSGGDVIRAGAAVAHGVRPEVTVVGGVIDRMVDVAALALLVTIGASVSTATGFGARDLQILLWVGATLALAALLLVFVLSIPDRWLPGALATRVDAVRDQLGLLLRRPARAATAGALAIAVQASLVLVAARLGAVLGIDIAPTTWLLAWPLAKLAATLPVSVGGLGVREIALAMILGRFGVAEAQAVGLGLLWDTILITGGGIGGLAYVTGPTTRRPANSHPEHP